MWFIYFNDKESVNINKIIWKKWPSVVHGTYFLRKFRRWMVFSLSQAHCERKGPSEGSAVISATTRPNQ